MTLKDFVEIHLARELHEINISFRKDENPELTVQEKALIYKYSEDGYRSVNPSLRATNGKVLDDFAKHLITALNKLPDYKLICYRTADLTKRDLNVYAGVLANNKTLHEPTFISCSRSKQLACYFIPYNTLFIISSKKGKEIEKIAKFGIESGQNEKEILFVANTKFNVLEIDKTTGINIITLEEK